MPKKVQRTTGRRDGGLKELSELPVCRMIRADDARRGEILQLAKETADRATENLRRWGGQDPQTLILCMIEELGEVAEASLRRRPGTRRETGAYAVQMDVRDVREESIDLGALCLQLAWLVSHGGVSEGETA